VHRAKYQTKKRVAKTKKGARIWTLNKRSFNTHTRTHAHRDSE
jgi:hypothetical protein